VGFVWFGDAIGVPDVYLAAVVLLGGRIFLNSSLVRRFFIERGRAGRAALESALGSERAATPSPDSIPESDIIGAQ